MKFNQRLLGWVVFGLISATVSQAGQLPPCLDSKRELSVDNEAVLKLKETAPLGVPIRAFISGTVTRVFDRTVSKKTKNSHARFEMQIGDESSEVIEVIYNLSFGEMPAAPVGAEVSACGDFINSHSPNNGYQASPSGAIIHWVHKSNSDRHENGFVAINNVLYGFHGESWNSGGETDTRSDRPRRRGGRRGILPEFLYGYESEAVSIQ